LILLGRYREIARRWTVLLVMERVKMVVKMDGYVERYDG